MNTVLIGLSLLAVASAVAVGEDLRVDASVDRSRIGVGQRVTLTITVYGGDEIDEPAMDTLEGFQIVNTYRSHSFSMVNMKVSKSLSLQCVLAALAEGEYTLGPFSVRSDDQVVETEPLKITVVKAGTGPAPATPRAREDDESEQDLVLLRGSVDKTRAYVGEQILYTAEFAYRVRLLDDTQYLPPDHTGFWFEDMGETGPSIKTINGQRYYVINKRTAFFPISSGAYTIGEATVQYVMEAVDPFSREPFGLFGRDPFGAFRRKQGVARAEPVSIEVLALPAQGRPSDFSGAVGQFEMSAVPSREEVTVGESLTLSVRIRGRGNIKSIGEIGVPDLPDFRVFAPKARESVNVEQLQVGGVKTFDLVLVPEVPGEYVIDGFTFSYFDPKQAGYKRTSAAPVAIKVLPGDADVTGVGREPTQSAYAKQDVRHIRRETISRDGLRVSLRGPKGMIIRYLPISAVLVGIVAGIRRKRGEASGRARIKKALVSLTKGLVTAESMLRRESRLADAAGMVAKAIKAYIAARSHTSGPAVDEAFIGSLTGISPERRSEVNDLLAHLDRVRFAPASGGGDHLLSLIDRARDLIRTVDREWQE